MNFLYTLFTFWNNSSTSNVHIKHFNITQSTKQTNMFSLIFASIKMLSWKSLLSMILQWFFFSFCVVPNINFSWGVWKFVRALCTDISSIIGNLSILIFILLKVNCWKYMWWCNCYFENGNERTYIFECTLHYLFELVEEGNKIISMNACECQVEYITGNILQFNTNRTWDTICYAVKTKMSLSQRHEMPNPKRHSKIWHSWRGIRSRCANTLDLTFKWSRIDT